MGPAGRPGNVSGDLRGEDQDVAVAGRPRVRQHGTLGSGRKGDSTRTELLPRENSKTRFTIFARKKVFSPTAMSAMQDAVTNFIALQCDQVAEADAGAVGMGGRTGGGRVGQLGKKERLHNNFFLSF